MYAAHDTTEFYLPNPKTHPHILSTFLGTHGISEDIRTISTDQGGELAGLYEFRAMTLKYGYVVEPTGAKA